MNALTPFWTVSLFWTAAVLCVAIALAFVLPPLLRKKSAVEKAARRDINIAVYRDQMKELEADRANNLLTEEQYQTSKIELEMRLAEDELSGDDTPVAAQAGTRKIGFALAGVLPVAAFGLYFLMGNPAALTFVPDAQAEMAGAEGEHDIMKLIQQVEEKTRQDPNDGAAWAILAKTYAAVGHWPEAFTAYEKAMKIKPDVPAVMTGYAEALAVKNNRNLEGEPMRLVLLALEKDPDDLKGLELAAIANFQQQNFAQAAYYFKRAHKLVPPESPYAKDLEEAMKEANRLAHTAQTGMDNLSDQGAAPKQPAASPGAIIHGKVDISPALKAKLTDKDVLFLFARAGEGGPPVAAIRAATDKFPLEFELNDSMAMNPSNRLSNFKEVSLTARIARSGDIKGAAGDFEGSINVVKVGAKNVTVLIDTVRK